MRTKQRLKPSTTYVLVISLLTAGLFTNNFLAVKLLGQERKAESRKLESGDKAIAFKGLDADGLAFEFEPEKSGRWTVLVFLRGYPGYQCPLCSRQVGELIGKADEFGAARTDLLFVYPGVAKDLNAKSKEFMAGKLLPPNFKMIVDSDYKIVNAYRLRWEAPRETAYPATLVIDPTGVVRYTKISETHGDRAPVKDVLNAIGTNATK